MIYMDDVIIIFLYHLHRVKKRNFLFCSSYALVSTRGLWCAALSTAACRGSWWWEKPPWWRPKWRVTDFLARSTSAPLLTSIPCIPHTLHLIVLLDCLNDCFSSYPAYFSVVSIVIEYLVEIFFYILFQKKWINCIKFVVVL